MSPDSIWILLTLLTTLIPTVVHSFVSVLALIRNILPNKYRDIAITYLLNNKDNPAGQSVAAHTLSLTIVITFSLLFIASSLLLLTSFMLSTYYGLDVHSTIYKLFG